MLPQNILKIECFRFTENAPVVSFNTEKSHGSKMTFYYPAEQPPRGGCVAGSFGVRTRGIKFLVGWIKSHEIQYFIHLCFIQSFHSKIHSDFLLIQSFLGLSAHGFAYLLSQGTRRADQKLHFQDICACTPYNTSMLSVRMTETSCKLKTRLKNLRL